MGVELPGVVLGRPRRIDHDRVERDRVAAEAVVVVEHVVLVLVDVAALPEAVAPLGQHLGKAGEPAELAQPRGRRRGAQQLERERAGLRPGRDRDPLAEIEAAAVGLGAHPHAVAPAREQPRHRRAVALRDAAGGEHLRRAVGPGVAAIGAELHGPAGLVELRSVARAEPDEPLLRAAVPLEGQPQRIAARLEDERDALGAGQFDPQPPAAAPVEAERERRARRRALDHLGPHRALVRLELLAGDDALGELDEVIVDGAIGDPGAAGADQPSPAAAQREAERSQLDVDLERPAGQCQPVGDSGHRRGGGSHRDEFRRTGHEPFRRSREGHRTAPPSSRPATYAGQSFRP